MRFNEFINQQTILREYRRDITARNYGAKLTARNKSDPTKIEDISEILVQIETADPTANKQYSEWIARRYIAGDFLLEDLSIVKQYLEKFIESRKLIPNKDINSYTLATLKELIRGIYSTGKPEQKEIAGLYPVLPETKVLYNGPEGQLVIPLSVKASQALQKVGHETEWCTADSRAPTHFPRYSAQGPLYVWIDKDGSKYQFHFPSEQYMNEFDRQLNIYNRQNMLFKHPVLSRYMPSLITDLKIVPNELRTEKVCLFAVQNDGRALYYVPKELQTEKMCLAAVQNDGRALEYVPNELKTEQMCLIAVQNNGRALYYVPKELQTEKMCLAAVQNRGDALRYVPKELQTEKMCLIAVQNDGWALRSVPNELKTEKMCLAAAQNIGWALLYVPKALRTEKVCLIAVQNSGRALEYVPKALRTEKVCLIAVQNDGRALDHVPKALRTEKVCLIAVQNDGRALDHVPNKLQPIIKQKLGI